MNSNSIQHGDTTDVINNHVKDNFIGVPAMHINDIPNTLPDEGFNNDCEPAEYEHTKNCNHTLPVRYRQPEEERSIDLLWLAHHKNYVVPIAEIRDLLHSNSNLVKNQANRILKRQLNDDFSNKTQQIQNGFFREWLAIISKNIDSIEVKRKAESILLHTDPLQLKYYINNLLDFVCDSKKHLFLNHVVICGFLRLEEESLSATDSMNIETVLQTYDKQSTRKLCEFVYYIQPNFDLTCIEMFCILGKKFQEIGDKRSADVLYSEAVNHTENDNAMMTGTNGSIPSAHERYARFLMNSGRYENVIEIIETGLSQLIEKEGETDELENESKVLEIFISLINSESDRPKILNFIKSYYDFGKIDVPENFVDYIYTCADKNSPNRLDLYMDIIHQSVGVEDTASLYRAASSDRKKYYIFPPDWGLDTYNKYGELFANDGLHRASASVYEDAVNYVERKDLADSKPHKRCAKQLVKCGKYGEAMDMLAAGDFHYRGAAGRASPMHIAERPVVGTYTKLIKEECTLEEFEEGVNAIVDDHRYNSEKNSPGPDPDNFYKLEGEFLNYLIQKNKKQRAIQLAREIIEREYSWKGWKGTCPIKDCDESISLDELACHVQSVHY